MTPTAFFLATVTPRMEAKLARTAHGLRQWEVAALANVPPWAISAYERGSRYVPPAWVSRIRRALDLDAVS